MAETERIIVTGSYIPTAETESPLPVTIYTADVLQKQGANTPAEGLRQLPSFLGNTATENDSNGGDGQAFINLRALGAGNTLILINGRRAFGFTNVNAIPISALARSEVLKDGASAIYGSDAVAGVVNFILLNGPGEEPDQGAEINLLYGNTTDHDAHVLQGYIRGGVTTDKVAIAAAAEYYDRESIYARDREISSSADQTNLGGFNNGSGLFAGRAAVIERGPVVLIDPTNNAPNAASYREFSPGTDPAAFNFRAFTPAIPGVEKHHYFVTGNYKVFSDALQLYGDLLYAKTKQDNGTAPAPFIIPQSRYQNPTLGIFNGRDANGRINGSLNNSDEAQLAIIQNSPFNPFGEDLIRLFYRLVQELNNRRSFYDYDFYRYVAGVKGEFSPQGNNFLSHLGYDAGLVYERADYERTDSGDATRGGIYQEIIAGNFDPFIGQNAPLTGTVPTYVNGIPTGATASYDNSAAAQRASYLGHSFNYSRDFLVDAKVNGNLLPGLYQGGLGFNLGLEYRQSRTHTAMDFYLGRIMGKQTQPEARRVWLVISVAVNLSMLGFFKYGNFLLENFQWALARGGIAYHPPRLDLFLPIGISFYTFHSLSYTLDIYRGILKPTRSLRDFVLAVSFFPQLVAGPIVRAGDFLPQLVAPPKPQQGRFFWGLLLMTLGLFEKVVLADTLLAGSADTVFSYGGPLVALDSWAGVIAFAGQIFFDFAGYSICAIGAALCLGFHLKDNFRFPYAAIGFSDFWRRWHISLSTFLRDYLYIPIGGNRAGAVRAMINLMIVMFIGGLWHGAAWTFVVWGLLHGAYLALERLLRGTVGERVWLNSWPIKLLLGLGTYFAVCVAWVFFRASDFTVAARMLGGMFGGHPHGDALLSTRELLQIGLVTLCMFAVHWSLRDTTIEAEVNRMPIWVVASLWTLMAGAILLTQGNSNAFIYFQF